MEAALTELYKEIPNLKFAVLKTKCKEAQELLQDGDRQSKLEAYELRTLCLAPLKLALESKNRKLAHLGVNGLQVIIKDDRFQSPMEAANSANWMPIQILDSIQVAPQLHEDQQLALLKLLLNMTYTTPWCLNATVMTKMAELFFETYLSASKNIFKQTVVEMLVKVLSVFHIRTEYNAVSCKESEKIADFYRQVSANIYAASAQDQVRSAVTATLTQLLTSIAERLQAADRLQLSEAKAAIEDFSASAVKADLESVTSDVVEILRYLCQKLRNGSMATKQTQPLLLEAIYAILKQAPIFTLNNEEFVEILWKDVAPILIGALADPLADSSVVHASSDVNADAEIGRGSGCSANAPTSNSVAQGVYRLANELTRLLGNDESMRPVLESLYHRMLLYPPATHRYEALQSVNVLLESPASLLTILTPTKSTARKKRRLKQNRDLALLQIVVDSLRECGRCKTNQVKMAAVSSVNNLFRSLAQLADGQCISQDLVNCLLHDDGSNHDHDDEAGDDEEVVANDEEEDDDDDEAKIFAEKLAAKHAQNDAEAELNYNTKLGSEEAERNSARIFLKQLIAILPRIVSVYTQQEADEELEKLASDVCKNLCESHADLETTLNAEAVYVTAYLGLSLSLQLYTSGYFRTSEKSLPLTQQQFVERVLGCGLLLYVSPIWLGEVYSGIISEDLLSQAGYNHNCSAFTNLLSDLDGQENKGGQLLSEFKAETVSVDVPLTKERRSGQILVSQVLTACWDALLEVLSTMLETQASQTLSANISNMLQSREENQKRADALKTCLETLHLSARLSTTLGLHQLCARVFEQLSLAACITPAHDKAQGSKVKLARLQASHVLSLDLVLSSGLEMGSHSADCWPHVFRCCSHVSALEHVYFSHGRNEASMPRVQHHEISATGTGASDLDMEELTMYTVGAVSGPEPVAPAINVAELVNGATDTNAEGFISQEVAAKALCGLSQQVDKLYEDASHLLNMSALVSFLKELCTASQHQLHQYRRSLGDANAETAPSNALLLYRLGDVLQRTFSSGRPLFHVMRAWGAVNAHLVEASCHRDNVVAKKAVTILHDCITELLTSHDELPYFQLNEALCKPLESLLRLELCDGDIQDQLVCSIVELCEGATSHIKSGWRSLFGALRAVHIEYTVNEEVNDARARHVTTVLDVFRVFLQSDDVYVFAHAAVDCVLTLLKYVRGPAQLVHSSVCDDDSSSAGEEDATPETLCIPSLRHLAQATQLLATMWNMPACPVFTGATRIRVGEQPRRVDSSLPGVDLVSFQRPFLQCAAKLPAGADVTEAEMNHAGLDDMPYSASDVYRDELETCIETCKLLTLKDLDKPTGVLHVWFIILEGLCHTVTSCTPAYQPHVLNTLFDLLRNTAQSPGAGFALHCVNHLVLPMLQQWLRSGSKRGAGFWTGPCLHNIKQCAGLCTDLVVELLVQFGESSDHSAATGFLLKQTLDLLSEFVSQPHETLARLGCSCIRHCVVSAGPTLQEKMWHIACISLCRAVDISLHGLRMLMTPFQTNSDNFYGDIGLVKVAVRQDCSGFESARLRQLAQQVFLLDSQIDSNGSSCLLDKEEKRSFIFLLYPPEIETPEVEEQVTSLVYYRNVDYVRVPFRTVVVGLVAHQLLLQTVGALLLSGCSRSVRAERDLLGLHSPVRELQPALKPAVPGMLQWLSARNVHALMSCLQNSLHSAWQFDGRPGLKFLMQKVARINVAANLYKQAGLSATILLHSLIELSAAQDNISASFIKQQLKNETVVRRETGTGTDSGPASPANCPHPTAPNSDTEMSACANPATSCSAFWVRRMRDEFDEFVAKYLDSFLLQEGPNAADRLASSCLVFLLAEADDLPTLKRERPIAEMVAEKLQLEDPTGTGPCTRSASVDSASIDEEIECAQEGPAEPHAPMEMDKVYTVATDRTINSLMKEYKKRKTAHTMPSFLKPPARLSKQVDSAPKQLHPIDPDDVKIHEERSQSTMKDSEAALAAGVETLCNLFDLLSQLNDAQFVALTPVVYTAATQLVCFSRAKQLREALACWMHRVGDLHDITLPAASVQDT